MSTPCFWPCNYATKNANQHIFKCPLEQPMAFWHKQAQSQTRGPSTYPLPRLIGPNITYTTASPCYTMVGKRKRGGFAKEPARVSCSPPLSPSPC
ncbi:outer dense fiber protein 3-like [Limosa lapponica baueri]|uniref:Outer dense fiber protein 3-like n=1 Tax=Limosa lapponica baueri TaxID=1758121 RepID=A0A2I0T4F0_LIMLA|nr:outer dense fiber protein 3-like [Limosa lapponica baueri]